MFKKFDLILTKKIILLTSRLLQTNKFREDKFSRAFIILNKTGRKNCIN
jgi:hypothetical protein